MDIERERRGFLLKQYIRSDMNMDRQVIDDWDNIDKREIDQEKERKRREKGKREQVALEDNYY